MNETNRVKSLSRGGNAKKDQAATSIPSNNKDVSSASSQLVSDIGEDSYEQHQEVKVAETGKRVVEEENLFYSSAAEFDKQPGSLSSGYILNEQEEKRMASGSIDRERLEMKNVYRDSIDKKKYSQNSVDVEEKVQKVSPPRRKITREERSEKFVNWLKKDSNESDCSIASTKHNNSGNHNTTNVVSRQYEPQRSDGNIYAILEVRFENVTHV